MFEPRRGSYTFETDSGRQNLPGNAIDGQLLNYRTVPMQRDFDEKKHWTSRLAAGNSIYPLVGHRALGEHWNRFIYTRRYDVLNELITSLAQGNFHSWKIADCGAGFGLFWPFWRERQVEEYCGLELSPQAVSYLRQELDSSNTQTACSAIQIDLATRLTDPPFSDRTIVTFMDVLFHVLDDEGFSNALLNGWDFLAPGGYMIFTDCLCRRAIHSDVHVRFRPLSTYAHLLERSESDFLIFPLFFVLCPPEPKTPIKSILRLLWGPGALLSQKFPGIDETTGRLLYKADSALFKQFPRMRSMSTSLIAVQK